MSARIDRLSSIIDGGRDSADVWAGWFKSLGDATRILILNHLAVARRAMTVGELVERLDVAQSTVSHHLKVLTETGFVLCAQRGTSNLYAVNERCLDCFPSAAELIMGQLPRYPVKEPLCPPWLEDDQPVTAGRARERTVRHA